MTSSNARVSVKLHKNVTLVRTTDPVLVEELLAQNPGALGGGQVVGHGSFGSAGRGRRRDRRASPDGTHAASGALEGPP